MAIQLQGNGGTVQEVDGTTFRAARVTVRPMDYGALGSYRTGGISGTMAAGLAANSEIFQFRWTDATRLAVITSVTLDGLSGSATAFTAGFGRVYMTIARNWSADGSGGTSILPVTNDGKMRTSMGTTLVNALRIASASAPALVVAHWASVIVTAYHPFGTGSKDSRGAMLVASKWKLSMLFLSFSWLGL